MQNLYSIFVNNVGQVSVDAYNDRRKPPYKWRAYFWVTPSSLARLRRAFAKHRKKFFISREWSPARWRVYRQWRKEWVAGWRGVDGRQFPCQSGNNSGKV